MVTGLFNEHLPRLEHPAPTAVLPRLSCRTSPGDAEQRIQLDLDRRDFFNRFICKTQAIQAPS